MRKLLCLLLLVSFMAFSLHPSLHAKPIASPTGLSLSREDAAFEERSASAETFLFRDLPRDLGGSMKASFWGWGSLAFALGAGLSAGLYPLDDDLQNSFETDTLFGETGNDVLGWMISPYSIAGVSLVTWIAGHGSGHPKLALTGRALSEALFLSMGMAAVAKFSFHRRGPDNGRFSFPSAHSAAAFSAAGVLTTFYGWKAAIPSYALASTIAISRIDGDHHFLSDVVMGAVLGSVIGIGTAKFHRKENPKFFLTPQLSKQHASLGITYLF